MYIFGFVVVLAIRICGMRSCKHIMKNTSMESAHLAVFFSFLGSQKTSGIRTKTASYWLKKAARNIFPLGNRSCIFLLQFFNF